VYKIWLVHADDLLQQLYFTMGLEREEERKFSLPCLRAFRPQLARDLIMLTQGGRSCQGGGGCQGEGAAWVKEGPLIKSSSLRPNPRLPGTDGRLERFWRQFELNVEAVGPTLKLM
jgi:hypothetical protein